MLPYDVLTEIYLNLNVNELKSLNVGYNNILNGKDFWTRYFDKYQMEKQYNYFNKSDWIRSFKIMKRVMYYYNNIMEGETYVHHTKSRTIDNKSDVFKDFLKKIPKHDEYLIIISKNDHVLQYDFYDVLYKNPVSRLHAAYQQLKIEEDDTFDKEELILFLYDIMDDAYDKFYKKRFIDEYWTNHINEYIVEFKFPSYAEHKDSIKKLKGR